VGEVGPGRTQGSEKVMNMPAFVSALTKLGACADAVEWARDYDSLQSADR